MKPRINFITIGVTDLEKSVTFYRDGLGLPTKGIQKDYEEHCLFELENNMSLVLYHRKAFNDLTANPNPSENSSGFIISHIASTKMEVDDILKKALDAGGKQVKGIQDEPWGYSANFADPDGHQWEIIFMQG